MIIVFVALLACICGCAPFDGPPMPMPDNDWPVFRPRTNEQQNVDEDLTEVTDV